MLAPMDTPCWIENCICPRVGLTTRSVADKLIYLLQWLLRGIPELAARMLEQTLNTGLPVAWVTGDTVYGSALQLRADLEARKQAYALAVTCKEHVEVQGTRRRVDQIAHDLA